MASLRHRSVAVYFSLVALVLLAALSTSAAVGDAARQDGQDPNTGRDGDAGAMRAAALHDDGDDDDDDQPRLGLSKNNIDDDTDLDVSKEDMKALGLQPPGKKFENEADGDALAGSLKNLGLTDQELAELKKMEDETNPGGETVFHGKKDKRVRDAAPPPGMVAQAGMERKSVNDPDRPPPRPHEPADDGAKQAELKAESELKAANEASAKHSAVLLSQINDLRRTIESARFEAKSAKLELARSKEMFQKSLESEKQEHKNEKEELTSAIEERKRAFDELYEEKQVLGQILSDEQKTLHDLQEKIQHPDLGLWIKQRAERAAILVETPETDAMKFYARKYMAPKVTKMRHRLALLEKRVEKSVDHLLPAKYGSVVALILSIGLVGFPVFVTMSTVWSVTKSVSLRQYVLLGNVFLTAFSSGLCIAGLILQQDPLQTLYEASESLFVVLQIATAIAFPIFVGVIFFAVLKSRDQEDLFVFGCELVFYVLVGLNYRSRVWRPAMLGENIETSRMMYVVYVIDFLSMTALTISSAKMDRSRHPSFAADSYGGDAEAGQGMGKVTGVTGSSSLASTRSGLGALGSGLMKAARGGDTSAGKEE